MGHPLGPGRWLTAFALLLTACSSDDQQSSGDRDAGADSSVSGRSSAGGTTYSGAGGSSADGGGGAAGKTGGASGAPEGGRIGSRDGGDVGADSGRSATNADGASGGGGMRTTRTCSALPPAGKWENITPASALAPYVKPTGPSTSGIVGIFPHPRDSGTLLMGTVNRGVFKSTDCGATWSHLNTGAHGAEIDTGGVILTIDPVNPDVMYATLNYGATGFWKSANGGVDWSYALSDEVKTSFQYSFVEGAGMDPADPSHIVISPHGGCTGQYAPSCMAETTDGGTTWRLFAAPGWEEGSIVAVISRRTWLLLTVFNGIQQTKDAGASWAKLPSAGGAYAALYRNEAGRYFLPSPAGIITSTDAETWTVIANSPSNTPAFVGTGTTLLACGFTWDPVHCSKAPESTSGAAWIDAPVPADLAASGAPSFDHLSYDSGHRLVYGTVADSGATTFQGGAWRMVMP